MVRPADGPEGGSTGRRRASALAGARHRLRPPGAGRPRRSPAQHDEHVDAGRGRSCGQPPPAALGLDRARPQRIAPDRTRLRRPCLDVPPPIPPTPPNSSPCDRRQPGELCSMPVPLAAASYAYPRLGRDRLGRWTLGRGHGEWHEPRSDPGPAPSTSSVTTWAHGTEGRLRRGSCGACAVLLRRASPSRRACCSRPGRGSQR